MPRRCCIPGCTSNYDSTLQKTGLISTFLIPRDEDKRKSWLQAIPRSQWTPSRSSVVCSEHFAPEDVIRSEKIIDNEGVVNIQALKNPKLREGAIPRLFPNLPSYLTQPKVSPRPDPSLRHLKEQKRHEDATQKFLKSDVIETYEAFKSSISARNNVWDSKIFPDEPKKLDVKMSEDIVRMASDNTDSVSIRACRACLDTKYTEHIQLDGEDWFDLYKFCIDRELSENKMAMIMCLKCAELLRGYAEFKRVCHQSETFWDSLLSKNLESTSVQLDYTNQIKTEKTDVYENKYDAKELDIDEDIYNDTDSFLNNYNDESFEPIKEEETQEKGKTRKFVGQCDLCSKVYTSKVWLVGHLKQCGTKVKKKSRSAILRAEQRAVSFCGICDNKVGKLSEVNEHLTEHYRSNHLSCKLCGHAALDFAEIMAHRLQHKPANYHQTTNYCILCPKFSFLPLAMEFHFRKAHLGRRGGYCRRCRLEFTRLKTWKSHEFLCRNKDQGHKCHDCGNRYRYKSTLTQHVQDCHATARDFVCEQCGRAFKRKSNYTLHVKMTHVKCPSVKCEHCDRLFKSDVHLQHHLAKLAKEHAYTCEVCSKQFITPTDLKKHMFWHTGEKPHKCETCGRKYGAKSQLNLHMKTHLGIFAHKCGECEKAFTTAALLRRHMSVHTGVRKYKCVLCKRSFHHKKLLKEHCLKQHTLNDVRLGNIRVG